MVFFTEKDYDAVEAHIRRDILNINKKTKQTETCMFACYCLIDTWKHSGKNTEALEEEIKQYWLELEKLDHAKKGAELLLKEIRRRKV